MSVVFDYEVIKSSFKAKNQASGTFNNLGDPFCQNVQGVAN